jgi:diaminopimelate epimerase
MNNKKIEFTKLQAAGNDFILIDTRNIEQDWSKLAQEMCHRHYGIGADGLVLLGNSDTADFNMRIINSDGSEAEICGNALRCLAKYVIDNSLIDNLNFTVSTLAGIKSIQAFKSGGMVNSARADMGMPRFHTDEIPVLINPAERAGGQVDIKYPFDYPIEIDGEIYPLSFVNMGNPHAVYFTSKPVNDFALSNVGPRIERNKMFVAKLKELTGEDVDIILPGGKLTLSWDGAGEVYLSGPVEMVFKGEWPERR